jgi:ketosteroid isomerase-like protein
MKTENSNEQSVSQIKVVIEKRLQSISSKNIEDAVSNYSENVLLFDVVGPLSRTGSDTAKQRFKECVTNMESPVGYDVQDVHIKVANNVAFCYSLNHISATKIDGVKLDMWWRETLCFEKIDNSWLIVHVHSSVPMDPESGKSSVTLKPDNKD